jgi:NAD(P)H-dependent flavin oxidoreductase YrpB (nitropropane dioxygenase family)
MGSGSIHLTSVRASRDRDRSGSACRRAVDAGARCGGLERRGLGFLGGAYLAPEQLREQLTAARRLTSGPLGVNLFVLRDRPVD